MMVLIVVVVVILIKFRKEVLKDADWETECGGGEHDTLGKEEIGRS